MLIIQGDKTQCTLYHGEGTEGLETRSVSSKLRKSLSLFSRKVVMQSSQPNCVAQDSQVWHLGRLHFEARQHIDHLALAPGRTWPEQEAPSRLAVKFFDNHSFPYYNVQAFHKPSRRQRKGGLRQSGLPAFAPEPCCSVKMASTLQRSFFRKDSNERR